MVFTTTFLTDALRKRIRLLGAWLMPSTTNETDIKLIGLCDPGQLFNFQNSNSHTRTSIFWIFTMSHCILAWKSTKFVCLLQLCMFAVLAMTARPISGQIFYSAYPHAYPNAIPYFYVFGYPYTGSNRGLAYLYPSLGYAYFYPTYVYSHAYFAR